MVAKLKTADLDLIYNYKREGVLDNIDTHRLDAKEGLSIIMCGDPDQHPEAYRYQQDDIIKNGYANRIHAPAPLGGALRLALNSRANKETPGYDAGLMYDLSLVHDRKGINTVALYVHAPCAIAELAGMNFAEIIAHAFGAKLRIKNEIPGMRVAVFCHIDNGERKQTWFVCRQKWEQYHAHPRSPLGMVVREVHVGLRDRL